MENTENQYTHNGHLVEAVQVTAVDYNGESFDGCPFTNLPRWLKGAYRVGIVYPMLGDTDYAEWRIQTEEGTDIASPGDWIVYATTGFSVVPDEIFKTEYSSVKGAG